MEQTGIDTSLLILADVETMLDQALKALDDGELTLGDVRFSPAAVAAAIELVKNAKGVPAEFADLDKTEIEALASRGLTVAYKVGAVVGKLVGSKK